MKGILFFLILLNLYATDLTLEIVKEVGSEPKIAIENSSLDINAKIDRRFFKLLVGDLTISSHFNVEDKENLSNYDDPINYAKYKDVRFLLRYKLYYDDFGELNSRAFLYDIKRDIKVFEKSYKVKDVLRYPFIAHKIVYDISTTLGYKDVEFLRSFVVFSRYKSAKKSDIVVSDYTLTYQKRIIGNRLNVFPKWADKSQRSFYYTDLSGTPTLYKVDIYKGTKEKIISSEGMLVCSDVSEDGSKLLLTMAPDAQADIYLYDVNSKNLQRLTYYKGIDVNGNFTQDDSKIVFVSDRLGYPAIFMKKIGSSAVQRLIYHGKNNSSCTTYKDYVAYTSRESNNAFGKNTFNIYLASTKSDYIRRLTANGVNTFPRFSKDGESLLFIKEYKRQNGLGVIRLKYNKTYIFPLYVGKIQSLDW
jgi:TolB protein